MNKDIKYKFISYKEKYDYIKRYHFLNFIYIIINNIVINILYCYFLTFIPKETKKLKMKNLSNKSALPPEILIYSLNYRIKTPLSMKTQQNLIKN